MMKYFFDVDVGEPPYVDEYGVDLASAEDIRAEVYGLAVALMGDRRTFEDFWSMTIKVSDAEREPVYELCLRMCGRAISASEGEADA